MCEKNQAVKIFPAPVVKTKKPKNSTGYYQCLFNASLNGFNGQRITTACRNCKNNSNDLNSQRNQEITNLMSAYEQLGSSLRNLLAPLTHD